jgi:hypothetical protein
MFLWLQSLHATHLSPWPLRVQNPTAWVPYQPQEVYWLAVIASMSLTKHESIDALKPFRSCNKPWCHGERCSLQDICAGTKGHKHFQVLSEASESMKGSYLFLESNYSFLQLYNNV